MITLADLVVSKAYLAKDFTATPTYGGLTFRLNTTGRVFDAAKGVGTTTATSTLAVIAAGGFTDQRITGVVRYVAPTVAGTEDVGMLARFQSIEDTASSTYYYARLSAGTAKLTKVVGGVFTNLSTTAFAVAQDVEVTIVLTCLGTAISASFTAASGPAPVTLSAVDSAIPSGGLMGWRTLSQAGFLKSFIAEQL